MTNEELIAGVRKHALENYSRGGWDILVECYEDEDILEYIKGNEQWGIKPVRDLDSLIDDIGRVLGVREERRIGAQAASGELEYYGLVEHEGEIIRRGELPEK